MIDGFQAGLVGPFGEWGPATSIGENDWGGKSRIVERLLEILPERLQVQVRTPHYRRSLIAAFAARHPDRVDAFANRIGIENDGFMADPSNGGTFGAPGDYDYVSQLSAGQPSNGELYWSDIGGHPIPGIQAAVQMRDHHFFRVIEDRKLIAEVEIVNRGFAAHRSAGAAYFVLIGGDGQMIPIQSEGPPIRDWQPHQPGDPTFEPRVHRIHVNAELPKKVKDGTYTLGLWLPDPGTLDPRYAIRFANDLPFWSRRGVNILGTLRIGPERDARSPAVRRAAERLERIARAQSAP